MRANQSTQGKPEVCVVRHYAPDVARQVQALLWLLDHVNPGPETPQPQKLSPGASNVTADRNGSNKRSTCPNDTMRSAYPQ